MTDNNTLSAVEGIKVRSRLLRGTLVESLADPITGALAEDDQMLIKFHGSYQQDDRDIREERRQQKLEPAYSFMIRTRLPGGVCSPAQWLALDGLADQYANGSLRLTTRQAFQLHGVIKRELKPTIAAMNAVLIDTIAACGDVNRNVMSAANPHISGAHAEALEWARRLSEHLLPKTHAYHEIWLDGVRVDEVRVDEGAGELGESATGESEPIYGPTYLPRKFKAAIAVPPLNDVDIFSQDLGFIAIIEDGKLIGFNLCVGGGMGSTHGDTTTFPRLADVIGFVTPDQLLAAAEAVVTAQRDFGNRIVRKHARLKYTIETHGIDWFKAEVEQRLSFRFAAARAFHFEHSGDRFGWVRGESGNWHLTVRIEAGRVADRNGRNWRQALAAIARIHDGEFRITPNQNLIIANVADAQRAGIDALLQTHGVDAGTAQSPLRLNALACVSYPTCPLAMAEAERYLPDFGAKLELLLVQHGLRDVPIGLRITGCPNGCARPFLAEIALVGKAPGRYNLYLGGDRRGQRLNALYRENIVEADILATLDPLLADFARGRSGDEGFADFLIRSEAIPAPPSVQFAASTRQSAERAL
ncbi:MAG: assimilatory sulfite reductase (NADPH) hemoprotein subunit [Pseudomonadota bacterium]|nr:assimilatory sulfite reductase (NADPH) hemoprotein subunit [Pseudomonadota bacterium]